MGNLKQRLSSLRPGLLGRISLALVIVGVIPVSYAAWRLIGINRAAMTDQVESLHAVAARTAGERIGEFVAARLTLARGLAASPALADPKSDIARLLLTQNLQAWASLGAQAIAVVDLDGAEVIRAQLTDEATRESVSLALDAPPSEHQVLALTPPSPPVLRFAAPLPAGAGIVWLVTGGDLLEDVLLAHEMGDNAEIIVAADRHTTLAGPPTILSSFSAATLDQAFATWITGLRPTFSDSEGEQQFIGAFSPVPNTGWAVLSRQPLAAAHAIAGEMKRQAVIAVAVSLLLITLLSAGAWATVVRPLRQLSQAQRRLAGIPEGSGSGSEIDQLKASFEALEQRVKEQKSLDEVFLGRYQVIEIVGSGAMGTVFRGWDPKLQRSVALKTIRLSRRLPADKRQELAGRLLQEAVNLARLDHPNVVSVFDIEDRAEGAFVAMQLVDGVTLEQLLWQVDRLPEEHAVPLGAAIAGALAAAHRQGVVHRDIKPANVLLDRSGEIKVTDFGISALITSTAEKGDMVFGTPGFLPPEALQGKPFGEVGDLFSLGAVLHLCLTGEQPFGGKTVKEIVRRTLFGTIEPPSSIVPGISPEVDSLIMRLLERKPEDRPQDAGQVATEFQQVATQRDYRWELPSDDPPPPPAGDSDQESRWVPTSRLSSEDVLDS